MSVPKEEEVLLLPWLDQELLEGRGPAYCVQYLNPGFCSA